VFLVPTIHLSIWGLEQCHPYGVLPWLKSLATQRSVRQILKFLVLKAVHIRSTFMLRRSISGVYFLNFLLYFFGPCKQSPPNQPSLCFWLLWLSVWGYIFTRSEKSLRQTHKQKLEKTTSIKHFSLFHDVE
jgi:hypothetical protein